jgi:hypothetical protein
VQISSLSTPDVITETQMQMVLFHWYILTIQTLLVHQYKLIPI